MRDDPRKSEHRKQARRETPAARKDDGEPAGHEGERIAKRLARAGVASRREAEAMVAAGRVAVNGTVLTSPAFNAREADRIEIDGTPIPAIERTRLFLFNKPAGAVTTNRDPQGRRTVFDVLPAGMPRLMTVGRLDINTEGLLLLTNDGGLARVLELPATGWLRRYRVRVHGKVDLAALEGLKEGIAVDGVFYGAVEATLDRQQGSNAWLTIGLREGKNREVRNIMEALGLDVTRLIRVSYGPFQLGPLAEGTVQEIKGRTLRDQLGERLIAQAGANFDAPIGKPFTNAPVRDEKRRRAGDDAKAGSGKTADVSGKSERKGAGYRYDEKPRPDRKTRREDQREKALGRLQTKPDRNGRADEDRPKRETAPRSRAAPKQEAAPRSRAANVWHAKGARPVGPKKAAEQKDAKQGGGAFRGGAGSGAGAADRKAPRRDARRKGPGGKPGKG